MLTDRVHQGAYMEWLFWVVEALLLVVIGTMMADLAFPMIAGGALGGELISSLGGPAWARVVAFVCVSALLPFAMHPRAKRHLAAATPQMKTNTDAFIGRSAATITSVDREGGRVRLGGEKWSTRLAPVTQGGLASLEVGVGVTVAQIDRTVAVTAPVMTSTTAPVSWRHSRRPQPF